MEDTTRGGQRSAVIAEEEGASRAAYALKLLQSEGDLGGSGVTDGNSVRLSCPGFLGQINQAPLS